MCLTCYRPHSMGHGRDKTFCINCQAVMILDFESQMAGGPARSIREWLQLVVTDEKVGLEFQAIAVALVAEDVNNENREEE